MTYSLYNTKLRGLKPNYVPELSLDPLYINSVSIRIIHLSPLSLCILCVKSGKSFRYNRN
jgi:hypothetical protein